MIDKEAFLINQLGSSHIGDDGAVIGDMVYSMDAFCEGVHFRREWMSPKQIARKAMLVNLSDAIAMNASPQYALVSVSIPKTMTQAEITELTSNLEETAREFGCEIIGGDTVGGERLDLSITIISQSDSPLYRSGLQEGDLLAYTGVLGESKRDLDKLFLGAEIADNSRFYQPTLRQEFIAKSREFLHSGMDISDGLYCDTNKFLEYNKLGFTQILKIPTDIGASGEEYEMLIGFAPNNLDTIKTIAKSLNLNLTIFAKVANNQTRFPCTSHHF